MESGGGTSIQSTWPLRSAASRVVGSGDRKSTRLNSSHSQISYAVFCLKKKKEEPQLTRTGHEDEQQRSDGLFESASFPGGYLCRAKDELRHSCDGCSSLYRAAGAVSSE